MKPIWVFALVVLAALISPRWSQGENVYRIGALVSEDQFMPALTGFKKRMAELGYLEGKNIFYTVRNAGGDQLTLKKMAEALVQEKPDLIATSSTTATVPIAKLTEGGNIPVVFLSASDPLRFVKSYGSSGNNITGISSSSLDLIEKRIALLKELVPRIKRLILLVDPAGTNYERYLQITREAAKRLGLELIEVTIEAKSGAEVKKQLYLIKRKLGEGILIPPDTALVAAAEDIAQQAIKEKLPLVGPNIESVKKGVLAAYSSDYYSLGEQGAVLVDKIFKGAKPADLPIEEPQRLKLAINVKTSKAIGLSIPKEILLMVDELVK